MVLLDLGAADADGIEPSRDPLGGRRSLVICMTGQPSVETAVATMKHRAFDYLKKPRDGRAAAGTP
jgi:DNA-binding NtrC family response regulator